MAEEKSNQVSERKSAAESLVAGYKGGEEMPLAGYVTLVGVYNAAFAAMLLAAKNSGRDLPKKVSVTDLILMGVATHKLTRLITKDWVTAPLRAPFTEYKESAGGGEVIEKSRGEGLQRAIGDLVTCPWCSAPWVAATLGFGFVFAPRVTRFVSGVFAAVTISDFLQHAYEAAKEKK
jgi:Protein of unknown function (DUF1360)